MPKISVLIPAYNVESYIAECLDSVLRQSLQDFEIICIDDASTDNTLSILREYEVRDNRIKVYTHDKNMGQSCGRNHALEYASGEYVYMLDADDMIRREMFEELYLLGHAENLDVIGFETENFSADSEFMKNVRIKTLTYSDTEVMDGHEALNYCMENETMSLSVPTFFIRREYLIQNNIRFVEGILHEDVGYILELVVKAVRITFKHKIYFLRRIRANSTMTKGFTENNIRGYLKSFYKSFELEPELKTYLDKDERFKKAYRKWQRDIYGRLDQLYLQVSEDAVTCADAGEVFKSGSHEMSIEIDRAYEILKLHHWRTEELGISECYLCGVGQYTERTIEAVGAQGIIIRGIIVMEDKAPAFKGFPTYKPEEVDVTIPVILSVSKYTKEEYKTVLNQTGINKLMELDFLC